MSSKSTSTFEMEMKDPQFRKYFESEREKVDAIEDQLKENSKAVMNKIMIESKITIFKKRWEEG